MTRKWLRIAGVVTGVVLVLAILVGTLAPAWLRRQAPRSFPQVEGEIRLPELDAPVTIIRDTDGVPHIYAQTPHDLFFAQGYVHAQDRFWQMDFWRHVGAGRLAEMFGKSQVETDKFLRTLGWERLAQEEVTRATPEDLANLNSYAQGVNAYLADHQGADLSLEYVVLKLLNPDYSPEPWTPVNTLTWAKAMAWDLRGNMDAEIERARMLQIFTPEQLDDLYPPYPEDHPVIVPGFQPGQSSDPASADEALVRDLAPAWDAIAAEFARLDALIGPLGEGIGSNNWVISGELTDTGMPILANDPHLSAQMPSIWYEVGLHCEPKTADCPYDLTGFSFAGVPGVVIGHNDRIAWGFTNVGPDVMDLYIEKINPDNPYQYEVNGRWVDMEVRRETIQVGGGDPVELEIRITRHGPIISDVYGKLEKFSEEAGIDLPEHYAIALRWTALEPSRVFQAIWGFNRAQNWEEFRAAASQFDVPAQNLVYADVDGNIGYQMPGRIPIRAPGHDGRLPVPGWTDDYEWQGYIPFEELPHTFNPPWGYVVTANNAVVGMDYPYLIATQWAYGFRAQRIVDMIENAPGPISVAYIQQMQGDNYDLNAETLVPVLLNLSLDDARVAEARDLLRGWDYQMHMDSAPAALFAAFWHHLVFETFNDEMPAEDFPNGYHGGRMFEVMRHLVPDPNNTWWDDHNTPEVETRDDIFRRALTKAVAELDKTLGKDPTKWAWGDLHTLTFQNQTLGRSGIGMIEKLFNRGPFRTSGGAAIVNATGWSLTQPYQVTWLPSMRMIVDLSDLSRSLTIHTTGQSGHAYHPHYVDMADRWRTIQYHPMRWTRDQVEADTESTLILKP